MKKISLFLFTSFFALQIQAQESPQIQEMGLNVINKQHTEETKANNTLGSLFQRNVNGFWVPFHKSYETYCVQLVYWGIFDYHVADYGDGTRIVTCLNGPKRGLQTVSFQGVTQAQSTNVEWYFDHFVHFYPYSEVISFPSWQVSNCY